jgi:hypothetical protein
LFVSMQTDHFSQVFSLPPSISEATWDLHHGVFVYGCIVTHLLSLAIIQFCRELWFPSGCLRNGLRWIKFPQVTYARFSPYSLGEPIQIFPNAKRSLIGRILLFSIQKTSRPGPFLYRVNSLIRNILIQSVDCMHCTNTAFAITHSDARTHAIQRLMNNPKKTARVEGTSCFLNPERIDRWCMRGQSGGH